MEQLTNQTVKKIMISLGADLCGIAGIDRFDDAPQGFHPLDVMPFCKSVISFGCRFPIGTLRCNNPVPYTRVRNSITTKMDAIALDFCIEMEKRGIVCVPIPTNESVWDKGTGRWRSIISQKHAAQAAGLGTIGRHSLLITPEFGSMVWLGAVLCEQEFTPDELKENICNECNLCVEICPVNALEEKELNQQACWDYAFGDDEDLQSWVISCHKCRDICPYHLGNKIRFRQGTIEDLDAITMLAADAIAQMESRGIMQWDELYPTREDFRADIEAGNLYAGFDNDKLAVVYVLNQEFEEEYNSGGWKDETKSFYILHRLCVNPKYQNQGIARITMEHIEKTLKAKGIGAIRLDVFTKNPYALKLYDRCGYHKVGKVHWRKGDFFLMEKYL